MSGALEKIRKFASAWRGFDNMFMNKVKLISAGNGSCSAEFTVQNEHTNPMGGLHGGISASLVDSVSSLALRTLLDEKVHVSVNINLTSCVAKTRRPVSQNLQIKSKYYFSIEENCNDINDSVTFAPIKAMSALEKVLKYVSTWKGFDSVMNKLKIISAGQGSCMAEFKVEREHINAGGGLHGGFSATLVDSVSSLASRTSLDERSHVSVDINLTYLKGAVIGDEVVINARTLRTGKNLAYLEVDLKNKKTGDLLVKGSHTKYILNKSLK